MCRRARLDVATAALPTLAISCSLITRITEWIAQFPIKTFSFQGNRNVYLTYHKIYSTFIRLCYLIFLFGFYVVARWTQVLMKSLWFSYESMSMFCSVLYFRTHVMHVFFMQQLAVKKIPSFIRRQNNGILDVLILSLAVFLLKLRFLLSFNYIYFYLFVYTYI